MLGILCFNEYQTKNIIKNQIVNICGVDFFEIELNFKREITDKSSKKYIKKAFKKLKKQGIKEICANKVFDEFMGEIKYHGHNFIWNLKQNEIVNILTENTDNICIYGQDTDKKVFDFFDYCAKKFSNIYIDFGQNTEEISWHMLKKYGISPIKLDTNYDLSQKVVVCFAVPKKKLLNKILINFTGKNIDSQNIFEIEFSLENYAKNTDITGVSNYLCLKNKDNAKFVKIKKI